LRAAVKIATWNVNSIRAREHLVLDWLKRNEPDVLCMQETKIVDEDFPSEGFQRLGYELAVLGQKSYNGVAIASRARLTDVRTCILDDPLPAEKRFLSAVINGVRVCSAYIPNGKSVGCKSFADKLAWLAGLTRTMAEESLQGLVLVGDFNVALDPRDVWDVEAMRGQLHFHPDEHAAMQRLLDSGCGGAGLVDAFRLHTREGGHFTWFDYRGAGLRRNEGLRIDYVFLSPPLADRCRVATHHLDERRKEKPSDHVPVVVELND
jgi:exodeoxyribonuclease-3